MRKLLARLKKEAKNDSGELTKLEDMINNVILPPLEKLAGKESLNLTQEDINLAIKYISENKHQYPGLIEENSKLRFVPGNTINKMTLVIESPGQTKTKIFSKSDIKYFSDQQKTSIGMRKQ